jgi:hypothetical protein
MLIAKNLNLKIKKYVLLIVVLVLVMSVYAQNATSVADQTSNYTLVITNRAEKIVNVLNINDSVKYKRVRNIIVDQYRSLNNIHDKYNAQVKAAKLQAGDDKTTLSAKTKLLDNELEDKLKELHTVYISKLGKTLTAGQIDMVKDGMTYNILPLTYAAYLDEVPALTEPQKAQIKVWLIEAREHAIDAESSEKKHAIFGKYKGRINNYLSVQGYNMKKEGEEWQKRMKAKVVEK